MKKVGMGASIAMALAMLTGAWALSVPSARAEGNLAAKCYARAVNTSPEDIIAACTAMIDAGPPALQALLGARFRRADAYLKKGEFERAIADYDQIIKQFPDNIFAHLGRANAHCRLGNFAASLADYEDAIRIQPQNATGYIGRGGIHLGEDDPAAAIKDFDTALNIHPENVAALSGRSTAYAMNGELDRAIADCDRIVRIAPQNDNGEICRGAIHRYKGDIDLALADYGRAIGINSKNIYSYLGLAIGYLQRGEMDHSLVNFDQAIVLAPKNPALYRWRAIAHVTENKLSDATDDLGRVIELHPKDNYGQLRLEIVRMRRGEASSAGPDAEQADLSKWPAPILRMLHGEMNLEALLAAADDPNPIKHKGKICEANFYAGELALAIGRRDEATDLLRSAANDCPKNFIEWTAAIAELRTLEANR